MSSDLHNYGIIGFTADNVGIDRRIYTGLTSTDPVLNVSYNGGRVDVYLNGIKLVGDHSEMPSGTRDYTFTQTGQGSSIQLRTGVALVSADVIECIGHVSGSGKTVSTYTPSVSAGNNTFNSSTTGMNGFTLQGSDLLNVYLNGVLLDSSDYTSDASADSVTITSLASGDVVHIQVIGALDYANFVPAGGGTFTGNVAVTGDLTVDTNTLKVDATNNAVGIGQTSNLAKLTVNSGTDNVGIALHSTDSGSYAGFADNSTTLDSSKFPYVQVGASGNDLVFATNNTAQMRVKSNGDISFEDNTDAKIKLPSAGGIYESDGTTAILTETSGATTLQNIQFNDGHSTSNISQFTAKAWVYWDGYTSPVNRNSFNCTLTRAGQGSFYITFTNNMSNAYFCVFAQGQVATAYPQTASVTDSSKSATRSGSIYFNENGSSKDPWTGQIVVFGD